MRLKKYLSLFWRGVRLFLIGNMRMQRGLWLLCGLLAVILFSCTQRVVMPSFYYWHTDRPLSGPQLAYLDSVGTNCMYVRFFDVDWDHHQSRHVPINSIRLQEESLPKTELVPVIHITPRAIRQLTTDEAELLSNRIFERIQRIADTVEYKEIQIDCNWDASIRQPYFEFLTILKDQCLTQGLRLSCLIYPHHISMSDSVGIPPVDHAMLLLSHIDQIEQIHPLVWRPDLQRLKSQLQAIEEYPLLMDVSLPISDWGLVERNREAVHLLRHLRREMLDNPDTFAVVQADVFRVLQNTYLDGVYLYENDMIYISGPSPDQIREISKMINPILNLQQLHLGFYQFDLNTPSRFPEEEMERIVEIFK